MGEDILNYGQQVAARAHASQQGSVGTLRGIGLAFACSLAAILLWACMAYAVFAMPVIGWFLAFGIVRLYALGARRLTAGGILFALVLIAATVIAATVVGFGVALITQEADAAGLDPWPLLLDPVLWQTWVMPSIELNAMLVLATLLGLGVFAALGAVQSIHWYRKAARARLQPLVYGPMTLGDMLTIAEFGDPEHRAQLARRRKLSRQVQQILASHPTPNDDRGIHA
jgi:hypothetical protein